MKQGLDDNIRYSGTADVLSKILRYEGLTGFFKGMQSKLVQSVTNAAFLFLAKEELVRMVIFLLTFFARLRAIRKSPLGQ